MNLTTLEVHKCGNNVTKRTRKSFSKQRGLRRLAFFSGDEGYQRQWIIPNCISFRGLRHILQKYSGTPFHLKEQC